MILIRAGGLPFSSWQSLLSAEWSALPSETDSRLAAENVQHAFDALLTSLPDSAFRTEVYNARKAFFQKQKMPGDRLLADLEARQQEPLFAALLDHLNHWKNIADWPQHFDIEYNTRLQQEWKAIQAVAETSVFRRTLLFASHDLLNRLPAFCAKPVSAFDKKDRQTAMSVLQYWCRCLFKTSPLGHFTTVQLWRLDQPAFEGFDAEKIAVTPSVAMLPAFYEVLLKDPAFYESLQVILNPCIPANYIENTLLSWLYFDGEQEAFQTLESNAVVNFIIDQLLENKRTLKFSTLLGLLNDAVEAPSEQLRALLQQLISIGLLEWQLPEKGLSPSWCSNLCNYLSFLPSSTVLTEAAFLLQLLRVSARAMSFQTLEEAQQNQLEAKRQLDAFFTTYNGVAPAIPAEQLFFEDVEKTVPNHCPESAIRQLSQELSECWNQSERHTAPAFRTQLFHHAHRSMKPGQTLDFQAFCASFFESEKSDEPVEIPRYEGKIGAMLQVYKEGESFKAVVNAMFPGGGKLYARWLHLFPTDFREALEAGRPLLFPWQGWSNANFQSIETNQALAVPDGRVGKAPFDHTLLMADLGVYLGIEGPVLVSKKTREQVVLTDLGLESPESRPPVLQVLWQLGVPYVSSASLAPENPSEWTSQAPFVQKRARLTYASLTLARAAWIFEPAFFTEIFSQKPLHSMVFQQLRNALKSQGVPRYFFARQQVARQKPQFFDQESAASMLLFEKLLHAQNSIFIEEMLPLPENWVLGGQEGGHVGEFVLEILEG